MSIAASILPEFDQEMAGTRKTLERIPDDKLSWKAHPKSNTIGWVAAHLAEMLGWVPGTLTHDTWDINPVAFTRRVVPAGSLRNRSRKPS